MQTSLGYSPLHLAARNGYTHIVKLLHKKGALINTKNYRKTTPLHDVADNGNQNIAEYLIQNGAELESMDGIKRTPLNCAVGAFKTADFKYLGMVECLITYGADVNAGQNLPTFPRPLQIATLMKLQTEFSAKGRALEQLLLKYGAEFRKFNSEDLELSENELEMLGDLLKKDKQAFEKEIRKRKDAKIRSIPVDEFFDVMKKLNQSEI